VNLRWTPLRIALVVFAPVLVAALVHPLIGRSEPHLTRVVLRVGSALSLVLAGGVGVAVSIGALRVLVAARWPVDATTDSMWPRVHKTGVAARTIGFLYAVLGISVAGSALFLAAVICQIVRV
jgi:hypothetical protein